jgi:hypothetical protein
MNNRRQLPGQLDGYISVPGSVTGQMGVGSGDLRTEWTGEIRFQERQWDGRDCYPGGNFRTLPFKATTTAGGPLAAIGFTKYPCGNDQLAIAQLSPRGLDYAQPVARADGSGAYILGTPTWTANGKYLGTTGSSGPAQSYSGGAASPDIGNVGRLAEPGYATPQPRSLPIPLGGPIVSAPAGEAVPVAGSGVGAGAIGVPEAAIPARPSIAGTQGSTAERIRSNEQARADGAAGAGTITGTGSLAKPADGPIAVTPPGVLVIPGAVLAPVDVRPDVVAIAAEVGRLERKAEFNLANPFGPPDLGFLDDLLRRIADLTPEENLDLRPFPGGTWTVADACAMRPPEDVGQVGVGVADQRGFEAAVLARFTALAQLLQLQKSRSGPVCTGPVLNGRAVTVHFVSDETSPRSRNLLRKQLTYRVQVGGSLESSTAHWAGFTWQAGDVVVIHEGTPAGNLKVFASTEAEGRRVVSHALADAGIDPAKRGEWKVTQTRGSRLGLSGTMRTAPTSTGGYAVTSRTASDGPAYVVTGPV